MLRHHLNMPNANGIQIAANYFARFNKNHYQCLRYSLYRNTQCFLHMLPTHEFTNYQIHLSHVVRTQIF